MRKERLEAFSDGVIAIIITIMVLELKIPKGDDLLSMRPMIFVMASYVLSFINVGIYWANHHHLFKAVEQLNGAILWANLHLLFWLSLIPFTTAWMGENHFAKWPVVIYSAVLLMAGAAYYILVQLLLHLHPKRSNLVHAIGTDTKGKISVVIYAAAIASAFFNTYLAMALNFAVAAMWFLPDRRIEKTLPEEKVKELHKASKPAR